MVGGAIGLVAGLAPHRSSLHPLHPVAAVVAAAFAESETAPGAQDGMGRGIAAVLNPGVAAGPASKPSAPSTTVASTTTVPRTVPRASTTVPTVPARRGTVSAASQAPPAGWGCSAALSWLSTHSAPGYQFVCPGYAAGHQAMTCDQTAACPGAKVIVIAIPCPAAYMNEAHNSWIISGLASGQIDPYGYCP